MNQIPLSTRLRGFNLDVARHLRPQLLEQLSSIVAQADALEAQRQPVAWMYPSGMTKHPFYLTLEKDIAEEECPDKDQIVALCPCSPSAAPQGGQLTDEQIKEIASMWWIRSNVPEYIEDSTWFAEFLRHVQDIGNLRLLAGALVEAGNTLSKKADDVWYLFKSPDTEPGHMIRAFEALGAAQRAWAEANGRQWVTNEEAVRERAEERDRAEYERLRKKYGRDGH